MLPNLNQFYLNTLQGEAPEMLNQNFGQVLNYISSFYNSSTNILQVPLSTTGRVKATRVEAVSAVIDNLTVRNQFTNQFSNSTTSDLDYVITLLGSDSSTRDASIGNLEDSRFRYIDINTPYVKLTNNSSIAFTSQNIGQIVQPLFDVSTHTNFNIMLDPSTKISIAASDASMCFIKLICYKIDPSFGTYWTPREFSGNFHKINI